MSEGKIVAESAAVAGTHRKAPWVGCLLLCATSSLLSVPILIVSLHLWRADLKVPFNYSIGTDSFFFMMQAKTDIETGWTFHNPLLGARGQLDQLDFPDPHFLIDATIHVLSWFTHDFGTAVNLCFLLSFPLVAWTTTLAARQIGLSAPASVLVALLYAFQPFHFLRGEAHPHLSAYYAVPLVIPAILSVVGGVALVGPRLMLAIAGFTLVGLSNPYYTAFAGVFLVVAAVAAYVRRRDRAAVKCAALLATVLCAVFLLTISPNLVHIARFGNNPFAAQRKIGEGDVYGLRLTQMLFPTPGHRIKALADLRDRYAAHAPMIGENESSAVGIVGACGVMFLLFRQVFGRGPPGRALLSPQWVRVCDHPWQNVLDHLAMLLVAGLLFGVVGGFGPSVNYFGMTSIRSYNRISIFLAFFALAAMGILMDRLTATYLRGNWIHGAGVCLAILIVGLLDQVSPRFIPNYDQNARDFQSDRAFVAAIESQVSARACIFQLPFMPYPESFAINKLGDYGLFRGFFHSSSLRWSYGAMIGRPTSDWQSAIVRMPLDIFLSQIRANGFSGIYLDRRGFRDDGIEKSLQAFFGKPLISDDGNLVFFNLSGAHVAVPPKSS